VNIYQILSENSRQSPFFAFILGLILYLLGAIVLLSFFVAIIALFSGITPAEINDILSGNMHGTSWELVVFRLIQAGNQVLSWGLAALLMAWLMGPRQTLRLRKVPLSSVLFALSVILVSIPLVQGLTFNASNFHLSELAGQNESLKSVLLKFEGWVNERESQSQNVLIQVLGTGSWLTLLANLMVFALLPALCEELFFRGFLQGIFEKMWNPHLAVWVSAFIFSLVHFQFYGFFSRLILGALLGYFVLASGSLIPSIVAHFSFNFLSILMVYLAYGRGILPTKVANDELNIPFYIVLFSLFSTLSLLIIYFRRSTHAYE